MDFDSLIIDAYKKDHFSQTEIDYIKERLLDKMPNYIKVMLVNMIASFNLKIVPFCLGPNIGEITDKASRIANRYSIVFSFYAEKNGSIFYNWMIYDHILRTYVIKTDLTADLNKVYNKFLEFIDE